MQASFPSPSFEQMLKNAHLRVTPARVAILSLLEKEHKPLSIQEIGERLTKKTIDQVTVYRTLASLVKSGHVRQIDLRHGHVDYELMRQHHHHIICTDCSRVEEIEEDTALIQKIDRIGKSKKFAVQDHAFEIFGLCENCQEK